ncbi:hypothetical protein VB002_01035 [Campylobacter concisus]
MKFDLAMTYLNEIAYLFAVCDHHAFKNGVFNRLASADLYKIPKNSIAIVINFS